MTGRYQEYSEFKISGVDWLGDVPKEWSITRLGGHFHERSEKVSDKIFSALSVAKNGIVPQLDNAAKTNAGDNRKKVCVNDFVINSRSDRKGSSGVSDLEGSVSLISIVLEPKNTVYPKFIHHLFRSYPFQHEFYRYGKGIHADLWSTNHQEMKNIILSLPVYEEQQKIANFLNHETAKIDILIAKQKKLIELLNEKRQAFISNVVIRGLNPDIPMKDSGVEWLGDVPEHWLHTSLKHYSNVIDCKHITAEFFDEGIPLASIGEVKGWFVNLKNAKLTNKKYYHDLVGGGRTPQVGDIIYSRNATVGEAAIVSDNLPLFALGQDVCLLRQSKKISSVYLMFVLHSGVISQQLGLAMVGSTFKRINVENIKSFLIAVPPFEEQEMIVKELEKKLAQYDSLISNAVNAIELMKERKTALISAAVTGKIDVRDWQL